MGGEERGRGKGGERVGRRRDRGGVGTGVGVEGLVRGVERRVMGGQGQGSEADQDLVRVSSRGDCPPPSHPFRARVGGGGLPEGM